MQESDSQASRKGSVFDTEELIKLADIELSGGNSTKAIQYLRWAVQRAPFREDLKERLTDALKADNVNDVDVTASGPHPLRPSSVPFGGTPGSAFAAEKSEEGPPELPFPRSSYAAMEMTQREAEPAILRKSKPMGKEASAMDHPKIQEITGSRPRPISQSLRTPQRSYKPTTPPQGYPMSSPGSSSSGRSASPPPSRFAMPDRPSAFSPAPAGEDSSATRAFAGISASSADADPRSRGVNPSLLRGVFAAAVFMIVFGGGWLLFGPGERKATNTDGSGFDAIVSASGTEALEAARAMIDDRNFSGAIDKLLNLPDGFERDLALADAHASQGKLLYNEGNYVEAAKSYEQALAYEPENDDHAFDAGWTYYRIGREKTLRDRQSAQADLERAELFFQRALEINSGSIQAMDGLSYLEDVRGNENALVRYSRDIIRLAPESAEAKRARIKLSELGVQA